MNILKANVNNLALK
ncbi:UNVERIFIED_CONTAM: hypothetical protein GTU68_029702 [Idotea baltica]|nr:hypothetical protein [Idotea baltica]